MRQRLKPIFHVTHRNRDCVWDAKSWTARWSHRRCLRRHQAANEADFDKVSGPVGASTRHFSRHTNRGRGKEASFFISALFVIFFNLEQKNCELNRTVFTVASSVCRYYAFAISFETYYPQAPQKPKWVQAISDNIAKSRPKQLPIQDLQVHELFKKFFGLKKAIKCKVS